MDRLINYVFLLLLIYLFVLEADAGDHLRIGIAFAIAVLFGIITFLLNWLTLDGAVAAALFGSISLGFGDWQAALLVLIFFLSSTLISQKTTIVIKETAHEYSEPERRDGIQVWANGFWFALFILLGFLTERNMFWMGAAGSIAAATADTWATELGSKPLNVRTYLLSDFRRVPPGTDGGVSLPGTLGALGGSFLIAVVAVLIYPFQWFTALISIFLAGFSGCFLDSYLGATLQQRNRKISLRSGDHSLSFRLDNNFVNWAATGFGSLAAIIINQLIL